MIALSHHFASLFITIVVISSSSAFILSPTRHLMSRLLTNKNCNNKVIILRGVLSRADILRVKRKHPSSSSKDNNNNKKRQKNSAGTIITLDSVSEAIEEAIFRQEKILDALANVNSSKSDDKGSEEASTFASDTNNDNNNARIDSVVRRHKEISTLRMKLLDLRNKSNELKTIRKLHPSKPTKEQTKELENALENLGFSSLLTMTDLDQQYLSRRERQKEFGRPAGFEGLVFTSPAGVPILVGREQSHGDATLRRVAQGSDLWFQVDDYDGSRVLLRTSLRRGTKGSKVCRQMAADLAAYYSGHRQDEDGEGVRIMYTDSRHVAKRGSKAGQLRHHKTLGRMMGHPGQVKHLVNEKEN